MLDKHVSRIYRWSKSEETGGTGGLIPSREQVRLLEHCRITGQNLRPEDFFSEGRLRTLIQSAKNFEAAE